MQDAVFTTQFPGTSEVLLTGASDGPASLRPFVAIVVPCRNLEDRETP